MSEAKRKKPTITFIAHWVESWNWLLWFSKKLHRRSETYWHWFWLWPVYALMSVVYLIGRKSFDVVDQFVFGLADKQIDGQTVLVRNFSWHFFLPNQRVKIRQRIIDTVLALQNQVDVIGLGALIKDERVTQGGKWIVDYLGNRLRVPIVHGDTLTAATVIRQAVALIKEYSIKTPVFLTGSTSKIGRAVALDLARRGIKVKMFTQDADRFAKIQQEAGESSGNLEHSEFLADGHACALWITGKAVPAGKNLYEDMPKGTLVLNFAVPNPLNSNDLKRRRDIIAFEGGLLAYDSEQTTLRFTMRLKPGLTYACHAGTFVHAYKGWKHHEVGPVDLAKLDEVWQVAEELGFYLPNMVR
jgi:hypothetical protein